MANDTVSGTPTLAVLTGLITVIAPYTGDDNGNNTCSLQFRRAGEAAWHNAFPLHENRANKVWQGVVYGLEPDTEYEVAITFQDPDGAPPPWAAVVRTQPDAVPAGSGPTIVVSTTGDDTSGTGSEANPYRTISRAVQELRPGVTVLVRGGVFQEQVNISPADSIGSATDPMTIAAWPGEAPVIEGELLRKYGILVGRWGKTLTNLVLRGLHIRNTLGSSIWCDYTRLLAVEDCLLEDPGGQSGMAACVEMRGKFLTARRNICRSRRDIIQGAVVLWEDTGGHHSIYKNLMEGGQFRDGVRSGREGSAGEGWVRDSEFYGNTIRDAADDGWQFEGGCARVVGWGNLVLNPRNSAVGLAPVKSGPCYIFRNLLVETRPVATAVAFKTGGNSKGKVYVVHNSVLRMLQGPSRWGGTGWENQEYYNNLFWVRRYIYEWAQPGNIFNHNLLYTEDPARFIKGTGAWDVPLPDLARWQAVSGQDLDSIQSPPLVGPSTGEPLDNSPVVDRAYFFPQAGEPYQGAAPDIGAVEAQVGATTYTLTLEAAAGGTTDPVPGTYSYLQGEPVPVTAIPAPGWGFAHWDGDLSGSQNPASVLMDRDKTVTAIFTELPATVIVQATPGGTTIPGPGSYNGDPGSQFQVEAVPDPNYEFIGWSGSATGLDNPLTVTVTGDMTLVANFAPILKTLTIMAGLGGTTSPAPGENTYQQGSTVQVTARPSGGYYFVEWRENGVAFSTANPEDVLMDRDRSIEAVFVLISPPPGHVGFTLTVLGQGTATLPDGSGPGSYIVPVGTVLQITASPSRSWKLDMWNVNAQPYVPVNPLVIQVNFDLAVEAAFVLAPPGPSPLPVIALGLGTLVALVALVGRR